MIDPIEADAAALERQLRAQSMIWVGAGASVAAGYPSGMQLVATMKKEADDPITSDDFPEVTDQFVRSRGAAALRSLLQREIRGTQASTSFHRALARLAKAERVHTIITTNYDELVERALGQEQVPYVVQTFEANFEGAGRDTVRIIKVHGSYQDWSRVVLSGASYARFAQDYRKLGEQLDVLCRQYPITFVGSSLLEPRVLGWLATLTTEERRGLLPWRAFLTADSWNQLLSYRTDQYEAKTVLEGQFRPLILHDHAALQTIWSEVAHNLAPSAADAGDEDETPRPVSDRVRCAVLLREALHATEAVYDKSGPTTILHRRLDVAERWNRELQQVLGRLPENGSSPWIASVRADSEWLAQITPRVRAVLPKAGEMDRPEEDPSSREQLRWTLYQRRRGVDEQLEGDKVLDGMDDATRWRILGFADKESYDDHLYPRLHQLLRRKDPAVRELARRLLKDPHFTPAGLAAEGFRAALVMDMVNAIYREGGGTWFNLSKSSGAQAAGRITPNGQQLLARLLEKSESR